MRCGSCGEGGLAVGARVDTSGVGRARCRTGHEVAKLRPAEEGNLSIAAMRRQGSSDGLKLDSGWE